MAGLDRLRRFLEENENLEEKKYVLVNPEKLNRYDDNPCAHDHHLFEVDMYGKIDSSCCGKFNVPYGNATSYGTPMKAPQMREKVAEIGRSVCGICVSSLYGNDDKD